MANRKNSKKVPFRQICDIRSNSDFPPLPTVSNTKNLNNHNQESKENGFQKNGNGVQKNESGFQKNGFQKNENGFQKIESQPNDKENRTPTNNQMSNGFQTNGNGFQKNENRFQKNESQPNDKENRTPTNNGFQKNENGFQKNENGFQKNENGFQENESQPNDKENRTPTNNQMSVKPEKIVLNELYCESTQTVRRFGETYVKVYRNDFPERIIGNRYELKGGLISESFSLRL